LLSSKRRRHACHACRAGGCASSSPAFQAACSATPDTRAGAGSPFTFEAVTGLRGDSPKIEGVTLPVVAVGAVRSSAVTTRPVTITRL
jgi:hypothetical protein